MASDNDTLLKEQMEELKELNRNLKTTSSALINLSTQIRSLELALVGNTTDISQTLATASSSNDADKQTKHTKTSGYVNWNSTHNILKTEHWMKLSKFTDFYGNLERGLKLNFDSFIHFDDKNVVDENTRFPEDDLYVNVSNPLVRAEILCIKEIKVATGLVERFLKIAKNDMHTRSSFEKEYGLKWVEPTELGSKIMTEPIQEASANVSDLSILETVPDSWYVSKDAKLEEVDSKTTLTIENKNMSEDELIIQELSKKLEGIFDKFDPQRLDIVVDEVKALDIKTEKQMEVLVDLLFEKVVEEPENSEVYATLCSNLQRLKVPSDKNLDKYVKFRGLLINKCQNQFIANFLEEKEIKKTTDSAIDGELIMRIDESNTSSQMRAIGNVRFISELYKLKMISYKIMEYCMNTFIDKQNEKNLECLCEILTIAGKNMECESDGNYKCNRIFVNLQKIVDTKTYKVNSRIRSLIQDVIVLRKRKWCVKIVKAFPKTMDEIKNETEKRALLIELMNDFNVGARGDGGAITSNEQSGSSKDVNKIFYTVDVLKLEATRQDTLNYIKLPPNCFQSISENMKGVIEKLQLDPTSRRNMSLDPDVSPTYCKNATLVEKTTFKSKEDYASATPKERTFYTNSNFNLKRVVKSIINQSLISPDDDVLVDEVKYMIPLQFHAAVIGEIINVALEKSIKEIDLIAKSLNYLVTTNTIAQDNFIAGLKDTFEMAPDLFLDIPKVYDYLGKILAPHIENDHITFDKVFDLSDEIVLANHGHLLLQSIVKCLYSSMGESLLLIKCEESRLQLSQWMAEELVLGWIYDNSFEFLEEFL